MLSQLTNGSQLLCLCHRSRRVALLAFCCSFAFQTAPAAKLRDEARPRALIDVSVHGEVISLDAQRMQRIFSDGPVVRYEWRATPGNAWPLVLASNQDSLIR